MELSLYENGFNWSVGVDLFDPAKGLAREVVFTRTGKGKVYRHSLDGDQGGETPEHFIEMDWRIAQMVQTAVVGFKRRISG